MLSLLDISVSGLRTDGLVHFSAGTPVEVEFACGARQSGCTMWRDEFSSGIMFDQLLDPADLDRLRTAMERQPHF